MGGMKSLPLETIMSQYHAEARTHPRLLEAMIMLTYGCNLRCVYCYNPTHEAKGELSTEQVLRILDELAEQGCLRVGFTGGELFTRRDALTILEHAKKLGILATILSNATLITPALADRIQQLDPYLVAVSIYGATAPVYEAVTGVPGSFARFVRGVDLLAERRVTLKIGVVVSTLNVHEFDAMKRFAQDRGLLYSWTTEIGPKEDGSPEPLAYRVSPKQAFEIWRQEYGEKRRQSQLERAATAKNDEPLTVPDEEGCGANPGSVFACNCGKSSAWVTPHGRLNLCLRIHYPQYDLARGSLQEGWEVLVREVAAFRTGSHYECNQCPLTRQCRRTVKESWLQFGAFDGPCISRFREEAELKQKFLV
jgi:MoaA/NifB/PqqE/SkfB family radical SAM enzyme